MPDVAQNGRWVSVPVDAGAGGAGLRPWKWGGGQVSRCHGLVGAGHGVQRQHVLSGGWDPRLGLHPFSGLVSEALEAGALGRSAWSRGSPQLTAGVGMQRQHPERERAVGA